MYGQRFGHGGGERSFAPVKVGQELDVKIEAVGEKGDGVAKIKGFVIFVPNVKEGDEVRIKINRVLKKVGFGEVIGEATGEAASEGADTGSEDSGEDYSSDEQISEDSVDGQESESTGDSENF